LRLAGNIYIKKKYGELIPAGDDETVILCLGESSTIGLWLDKNDSYPKQLETMLQKQYENRHIRVIIPPHLGQNTSHMLNRMDRYINLFNPSLIIIMAGVNNEWSLSESNIIKFLNSENLYKLELYRFLDSFRIFKVLRYTYIRFASRDKKNPHKLNQVKYSIWGCPEYTKYPPRDEVWTFAIENRKAFRQLWHHDVTGIIQASKNHGIPAILMTYHLNPPFLKRNDFFRIAREQDIPLVRNDKSFNALIKDGVVEDYLLHDKWHPNRDGYTIIARNVFECILEKNLLQLNH
jgi:lysophospholipase L1-like esterase